MAVAKKPLTAEEFPLLRGVTHTPNPSKYTLLYWPYEQRTPRTSSCPPQSRAAELVHELVASLEEPRQEEYDQMLYEIVEHRVEAFRSGKAKLVSGEEVRKRFEETWAE